MLEIPESNTVTRQLEETVKGKTIASVVANSSPHGFAWYFGDPEGYNALLAGRTIDAAQAVAGLVELRMGAARLQLNDGINLRYLVPGEEPPKKHQLYMVLGDGSALVCTVAMYGGMQAFIQGAMDDNFYYRVARDKPGPLTDDFDAAYFDGIVAAAKPSLSAKALLATEQRIPGLGNGTLQDILFRAGVHPKTQVKCLVDSDLEALFRSVKDTLGAMTDGGGRDTEKDLFGQHGGYRTILSKNTLVYPCLQCGGGLVKQAYLGGAVYFCPVCQPLKK